jgi:hypothetical protein
MFKKRLRASVALPVNIIGDKGHQRCDCKVLELSKKGALLEVAAVATLPDRFELALSSEENRSCRVIWRSGNCVGILFDETESSPKDPRFLGLGSRFLARSGLRLIPDLGLGDLRHQDKP